MKGVPHAACFSVPASVPARHAVLQDILRGGCARRAPARAGPSRCQPRRDHVRPLGPRPFACTSHDPLAEALLVHALRMLAQWLPLLHTAPDHAEPRLRLMLAALLCGQGSDYVSGGLAQALSHAAGPRSSVSNGVVEALLLPHTMRFNAPVSGPGLALIAESLDTRSVTEPAADKRAVIAVERFLASLAVPARLRDVGITRAALAEVADHAMDDWAITRVPRRVERPELDELLHAAW